MILYCLHKVTIKKKIQRQTASADKTLNFVYLVFFANMENYVGDFSPTGSKKFTYVGLAWILTWFKQIIYSVQTKYKRVLDAAFIIPICWARFLKTSTMYVSFHFNTFFCFGLFTFVFDLRWCAYKKKKNTS